MEVSLLVVLVTLGFLLIIVGMLLFRTTKDEPLYLIYGLGLIMYGGVQIIISLFAFIY